MHSSLLLRQELTRIATAAPAIAIVRTDAKREPDRPRILQMAQIFKSTRRQNVNITPPHDGVNEGAQRAIATFLGVSLEVAAEIYLALARLSQINPHGAWCLQPSNLTQPTALKPATDGFRRVLIDSLSDSLPGIGRIETDFYIQGMAEGHTRRRTFIRFHDRAGQEVAALDTSHFATHLESLVVGGDKHAPVNVARAHHWAGQLGAAQEDMPFILHHLRGLFADCVISVADLATREVAR